VTTCALLNGKELAEMFGLPLSTFHLHRRQGAFRHLEVLRPVGHRKYSRELAEAFLRRESTVRFVRRSS
jgi:hypothetical protein